MKKHFRFPGDSTNEMSDIVCDICNAVVDFQDPDWQEADVGVICGNCSRAADDTVEHDDDEEYNWSADYVSLVEEFLQKKIGFGDLKAATEVVRMLYL